METAKKSFGQKIRDLWKNFCFRVKHPPQLSPKKCFVITLVLLLCAAGGLALLSMMISTQDFTWGRFSSYFHEPVILLLNFLPVLLFTAFFFFAGNRAWIAYCVTSLVVLLVDFINYFKVVLRGDPFVLADISEAGEAAGILGHYQLVFPLWFFLSLFLWVAGTLVLLRYARWRVPKKRWWVRVIGLVLCIGLGALSWSLWYSNENLYNAQDNHSLFSTWKDSDNYASHGTVYSFLHSINSSIQKAPEGYSEKEAEEILSAYPDVDIPEEKKVNVVATMLESFSDLSVFDSIHFTADPYAEFHELLKECRHGTLIVDTIGGDTVNAERSFLTGFTFPHPKYHTATNSFVRYFSDQGYITMGGHPGHDWFYDRQGINKRLGFDEYLFMENHYGTLTDEEYALDDVFFPEQARLYDEACAEGEPLFSFSVSYQNHSPYDSNALNGQEYVSPEGISHEAYCTVNNYLSGVADTGKRVSAYVDTFRGREEPVVLVFFGDHKPTLGIQNVFYEEMGVNVSEGLSEGCRNLYSTPYWIWANEAALEILQPDLSEEGPTISPAFLMSEVFDFCGWEGPGWLQYERQFRDQIPVIHRRKMFGGGLSAVLTDAEQALYDEFTKVEFYQRTRLHDSQK